MKRWVFFALLLSLSAVTFAQKKREAQYRSDGKNAFYVSVLPGYDKFTRTFGLGIEGSYSRIVHPTIDIRVFQRYHRMVDETQFDLGNVLVNTYLLTGVVADISVLQYEKFSLKLCVGPVVGYHYMIRSKDDPDLKQLERKVFAGFNTGATFEAYPVKKLVLGLRLNYDQLFSNSNGYGNIYPAPYIGVRF